MSIINEIEFRKAMVGQITEECKQDAIWDKAIGKKLDQYATKYDWRDLVDLLRAAINSDLVNPIDLYDKVQNYAAVAVESGDLNVALDLINIVETLKILGNRQRENLKHYHDHYQRIVRQLDEPGTTEMNFEPTPEMKIIDCVIENNISEISRLMEEQRMKAERVIDLMANTGNSLNSFKKGEIFSYSDFIKRCELGRYHAKYLLKKCIKRGYISEKYHDNGQE